MSEVSTVPKNRPTPSEPATSTSTARPNSSRAGPWVTEPSSAVGPARRAVGCRAKAVTNTSVRTAAPIIGAAGFMVVARSPTRTGPNTKAVSSAADS